MAPAYAPAYTDAADALLTMSKANYAEIDRLLALGVENAGENAGAITEWAQNSDPYLAITVPFSPDYDSPEQINTDGITTGNQTNAAKYGGAWRGGLLTWQGDWVYLSRPDEDFAIYKMRADGTGDEMLFPFDMRITTLNVANNTLYICFGLGYEEDGFYISEEIVTLDLATLSKQLHFGMDTEPLCTGPDGWTYFMRYSEGMAWYAMDENGAILKLG